MTSPSCRSNNQSFRRRKGRIFGRQLLHFRFARLQGRRNRANARSSTCWRPLHEKAIPGPGPIIKYKDRPDFRNHGLMTLSAQASQFRKKEKARHVPGFFLCPQRWPASAAMLNGPLP
jgi:hypothetical protein